MQPRRNRLIRTTEERASDRLKIESYFTYAKSRRISPMSIEPVITYTPPTGAWAAIHCPNAVYKVLVQQPNNDQGTTYRISGLNEDSARSGEFTYQTFSRGEPRDDTTRGDPFEDVLRVPSNKMAVVHNIPFSLGQLICISQ